MGLQDLSSRVSYVLIFLTAAFNVCILSYDASIINNLNVNETYIAHFNLDANLIGLNAAIVSAGAVFGGLFIGTMVDRWGRKVGMAVGAILIIVGVIMQASAKAVGQFIAGRFLIGVAMNISGSVAPMWVMELASPKRRQLLSGFVMTTVPFAGTIACWIMLGIYDSRSSWAWRGAIMGEAFGAIGSLIILPFVDESPRWLVMKGRQDQARRILVRLHADGDSNSPLVDTELAEISATLQFEKETEGSWSCLIKPASNRRRFVIAVLTNVFYQMIGVNMILYFLSLVIRSTGITETRTVLLVNMGLVLWNTATTFLGAFTIERFGRRPSLIFGTSVMIACFALMAGMVYLADTTGELRYAIGAIVVVAIFEVGARTSWMILAYSYPPELLRFSQRAKGVTASQSIGWAFSFFNLYTAPIAITNLSWKYYAINGGWNVIFLVVVILMFPETKGKTLEEIDEIFEDPSWGHGRSIEVVEGENLRKRITGTSVVTAKSSSEVKNPSKTVEQIA